MLTLVGSDTVNQGESFRKNIQKLVIQMIHGSSQVVKSVGWSLIFKGMFEIDSRKDIVQLFWGDLLFGITPGLVRIMVGFDHQSVQAEIDRPLGRFKNSLSSSYDMAGIIDDFHAFPFVFQVDGHRPVRLVSEPFVISIAKASVNSC